MFTFYSKILVAYDGSKLSKKALNDAIELARQNPDVDLKVVTVLTNFTSYVGYDVYDVTFVQKMRNETEKIVKEAEEALKSAELENTFTTHLLEGNAGKKIVEFANEHDCDLIILGSRGLSGLKELFLGSVSHYVIQHAKCPVFVVK